MTTRSEERRASENFQARRLMWYGAMHGAYRAMSEDERQAFLTWDREHVTGDGEVATSDWPGWERYIGRIPEPPTRLREQAARKTITASQMLALFRRDRFTCQACGTHDDLVIDHIRPVSRGGTNEFGNLQTLCWTCNSRKGARFDG